MGLAYGFFDVVVFRCPIHREKVTIASQKPQFFCNENSSTDFTGPTKNLTKVSNPPVKNLCSIKRDPLNDAKSLEHVAIGLAYGVFLRTAFLLLLSTVKN